MALPRFNAAILSVQLGMFVTSGLKMIRMEVYFMARRDMHLGVDIAGILPILVDVSHGFSPKRSHHRSSNKKWKYPIFRLQQDVFHPG